MLKGKFSFLLPQEERNVYFLLSCLGVKGCIKVKMILKQFSILFRKFLFRFKRIKNHKKIKISEKNI